MSSDIRSVDASTEYPHMKRGMALALLGGIFWGFSGNCAEVLIDRYDASVIWLTSARMLLASAVFLAISLVRYRSSLSGLLRDKKALLQTMIFGVFGILLMQYSYLFAIEHAGVGCALMFEQTALVFIMVYVCIRKRRLPMINEWLGVLFAFFGVFCISTQGDPTSLSLTPQALVWCVISGVSMALYNILPEKPLSKYKTVVVSGVGMMFGALVSIVCTHAWDFYVDLPIEGWFIYAALVIVGTIAAYLMYIQAIRDAGPMRAALLAVIEPVTGVVVSAIWVKTPITPWDVFGLIFIVAMVVFETVTPSEKKSR